MNRKTFDRVMALLEERYNRPTSGPLRDFYFSRLSGVPDAEFEAQATIWLDSEPFWPSPADLRPRPSLLDGLEWLDKALSGGDWRKAPDKIKRVLRIMGGDGLRRTSLAEVQYRRKEFAGLFEHATGGESVQDARPDWTPEGKALLKKALGE